MSFTVVVQSTDGFADCWVPFFTLMRAYWPECRHPILLNTETRSFSFPGLDVRATRLLGGGPERWPTWSESLLRCLDRVDTDLVLLMIDDQFISGRVDVAALDTVVERMRAGGFTHVTLTEHGHHRPTSTTDDPWLRAVAPRARYRVSTAPALWRKDGLSRYLRPRENAWQFEIFGSRRAWRANDTFFTVDPARLSTGLEGVIPYFQTAYDTGIIKGKWQPEIEPFFRAHGIDVDCTARGFFKPLPGVVNKYQLLRKLLADPRLFVQGMLGR